MRVLVTGIPGSGKSTLAEPLSTTLGWPLLSKDAIKEALWDALGPGDRAWSSRLGAASVSALHSLVVSAPSPVVVDNFVHARFQDSWAFPDAVEVHCVCPAHVARERYAQRTRSACHFDKELLADSFDIWVADDACRSPIGPRLDVDTSSVVDVDAVVRWVRGVMR